MSKAIAKAIDLQAKRKAAGHTQQELGEKLGVSLWQVVKYESGRHNIPTPQACEVALLYGSITLEYDGKILELRPKEARIPEIDMDMTPMDGALTLAKEMRDVERHLASLVEHAAAVRKGRVEGKEWITVSTKEIAELITVGKRYLRTVKELYPAEWAKGMAMALTELAEVYGVAAVDMEIGSHTVA